MKNKLLKIKKIVGNIVKLKKFEASSKNVIEAQKFAVTNEVMTVRLCLTLKARSEIPD